MNHSTNLLILFTLAVPDPFFPRPYKEKNVHKSQRIPLFLSSLHSSTSEKSVTLKKFITNNHYLDSLLV